MARCRAAYCPEDDLPDELVFCWMHWELLGSGAAKAQERLADAYGTEDWRDALAECVRALRMIEGDERMAS